MRAALLALLVLAAAKPARAQDTPLPPSLEGEVRRLTFGGPFADGSRVDDVRILPTLVEVDVRHGAETSTVALVPRGHVATGTPLDDTASFSAFLFRGPPGPARALVARVAARDHGTSLDGLPIRAIRRAGDRPFARLDDARRLLTWVALLASLAWAARGLRRRVGADAWLPAALTAAALVVRLTVPPWAPLHANMHGIAELRGLLGIAGGPRGDEADRYGVAYRQLCHAAVAVVGRRPETVFGFGALAGSLVAAPSYLLARRLARSTAAGVASGLAVALTPALVIVSPTECPSALTTLLFVSSLALGARALSTDVAARARRSSAWAAALALACACELGPMTLLLVPAAFVAATVYAWPRLGAAARRFALPSVAVVAAAAMHALALLRLGSDLAARPDVGLAAGLTGAVSDRALWNEASLVSPAVGGLALVAVAAMLRRRPPWQAAAIVATTAGLAVASCTLMAARSDAIRYEALPTALLCTVAGASLAVARTRPVRAALAAVAIVGIALGSVPGLRDATRPSLDARSYALATRVASAQVRVVVPSTGPYVLADFPDGNGRAHAVLAGDGRRADQRGAAGERCAIWIGPECWSFTSAEVADGVVAHAPRVGGGPMRSECVALLGGTAAAAGASETLVTVDVPHRNGELHRLLVPRPRLGLVPCPR